VSKATRPPEAEADGEDRARSAAFGGAEIGRRGSDVGGQGREARLADVGHVLEGVVAGLVGRGPAEVVQGHRIDACLGEAEGQLLEEGVEAADVGEDHDAGAGRFGGPGGEEPEAVAVVRLDAQRP